MENAKDNPLVAAYLAKAHVLSEDPFVLLDIGCSGGIDSAWRSFGTDLVAYGFDPQRSECERLQAKEDNPRISYLPKFVGLEPNHEFMRRKAAMDPQILGYFNPWSRLSAAYASSISTKIAPQSNPVSENVVVKSEKVGVADFVRSQNLASVDFIKIDVDGPDLEVVISTQDILKSHGVLGFAVEVNFTGSYFDADNTFHNMDRLLRSMGYALFDIAVRHYSRKDLPAPFLYNIFAQTSFGQSIQGDVLYLRDVAAPQYHKVWDDKLRPTQILKLAALFEMFNLPDCAAELILAHRGDLSGLIDVGELLNVMTPPLRGQTVTFAQYQEAFHSQMDLFFPDAKPRSGNPEPRAGEEAIELFALGNFVRHHARAVTLGRELRVVTPSEQWSYAVSFLIDHRPAVLDRATRVLVDIKVGKGKVGIGLLSLDDKLFLREVVCGPTTDWLTVELQLPSMVDCKALVVRNVADGGSESECWIRSIRAFTQA